MNPFLMIIKKYRAEEHGRKAVRLLNESNDHLRRALNLMEDCNAAFTAGARHVADQLEKLSDEEAAVAAQKNEASKVEEAKMLAIYKELKDAA